jgi:hypothetical protein
VGAPEKLCAFSILGIRRCTVFGEVQTHAIEMAENCNFMGAIALAFSARVPHSKFRVLCEI